MLWYQRWKWVSGSWVTASDPLTHDEINCAVACNFKYTTYSNTLQRTLFLVDIKKLLTHSIRPIIIAGGLILIYNFFALKTERVVQYHHATHPPSPMRRMKWCNSHGSWVMGHVGHGSTVWWVTWVMGHKRWPISISVWYSVIINRSINVHLYGASSSSSVSIYSPLLVTVNVCTVFCKPFYCIYIFLEFHKQTLRCRVSAMNGYHVTRSNNIRKKPKIWAQLQKVTPDSRSDLTSTRSSGETLHKTTCAEKTFLKVIFPRRPHQYNAYCTLPI